MCEPTDENDSRRKEGLPGWYCCKDGTWNPDENGFCRTCSRPRHRTWADLERTTRAELTGDPKPRPGPPPPGFERDPLA